MNKFAKQIRSDSGQAIVEYILILVVVITLALALMTRFSKPFAKWAQFYIGDYIECLLDQGELPALGGTNTVSDCEPTSNFKEDGGGGKGGKGSNTAENSGPSGSGSRSRNSGAGRTLRTDSGGRFKELRIGGFDGAAADSKVSSATAENRQSKGQEYFRGRTPIRIEGGKGSRATGFTGVLQGEVEKIKKREQKVQKVASAMGDEISSPGQKKFEFTVKERKPTDVDLTGGDWSFGKLLRLLLIILIAIALVLFMGGQLMQISKSMEK